LTNEKQYVGSDVLIAVVKSSVFCDIIPCKPVKFNRRFGGTCLLRLESQRETSVKEAASRDGNDVLL
jgi:hypothetical protein